MKNLLHKIIISILILMIFSSIMPTNTLLATSGSTDTQEGQGPDEIEFENLIQLLDKEATNYGLIHGNGYRFTVKESGNYQLGRIEKNSSGMQATVYLFNENEGTVDDPIPSVEYQYNGESFIGQYLTAGTTYWIKEDDYNKASQKSVYKLNNNDAIGSWGDPGEYKDPLFEMVEKMIAWNIRTTANGLIALINWAVGGEGGVTIDKIIFNHYKPTQLTFFEKEAKKDDEQVDSDEQADGKEGGHELVEAFSGTIATWFNNFRNIAIVGYSAILLYIGIRVVLKSTADGQAELKRLAMDWVVGLALLFLFPYVIRYSIALNNDLVKMVEESKGWQGEGGEFEYPQKEFSALYSDSTEAEINGVIKNLDSMPSGADNSRNYMMIMARKAETTGRISYAIIYLIMAWQLLMIIIAYYKRLFMVAFLLVLLPVVALTYAIDKVKDGKSQAFDIWGKELLVNIFIQTFHAIIYVFAMGITLSTDANINNDWLLKIIGVSFLFKGEEIIKNLFGLKTDTVQSLGTTAMKTMAAYTAIKAGATGLKDNVIGKNSHLGRAWEAHRNAKTYAMMANNFNKIASTGPAMPSASALPHAPATMDDEATNLGNAIQVINHANMVSPKELGLAIATVQQYWQTGGKHVMMLNDLQFTKAQLDGMQKIKEGALKQIKAGTDTEVVTQNIKMELETLFPEMDVSLMQQALYHQMASPLVGSNHLARNTSTLFIRRELEDAKRRREEIENSLNLADTDGGMDIDLEKEAKSFAFNIFHRDVGEGDDLNMARKVVMLKNRSRGNLSAQELMDASNEVFEHGNDKAEYRRMIKEMGCDPDELRHILAEKNLEKEYGADYRNKINSMSEEERGKLSDKTRDAINVLDHYEKSRDVKKEDLDEVSIHTLIRNENTLELEDEHLIKRVQAQRKEENREEADLLREFANEVRERNSEPEPMYNGMTEDDVLEKMRIEQSKTRDELFRAGLTTGAAIVSAPIGAAAGIAFVEGDDSSAIKEGIAGASAGMAVGDWIAETAIGRTPEAKRNANKQTKRIVLRNPYTGEDQEVEIVSLGAFSEKIYSYDDPSLPREVSARIREQFLEAKIQKQRAMADARRKQLEAEKKKKK